MTGHSTLATPRSRADAAGVGTAPKMPVLVAEALLTVLVPVDPGLEVDVPLLFSHLNGITLGMLR